MKEKCCVKKCKNEIEIFKHKLCRTHYMRYRRYGCPGDGDIKKKKMIKPYTKVA